MTQRSTLLQTLQAADTGAGRMRLSALVLISLVVLLITVQQAGMGFA